MNLLSSLRRVLAVGSVIALALTTLGTARAAAIDFLFTGNGFALASPCDADPTCLEIGVVGVADDYDGLVSPIPESWARFASITVLSSGAFSGTWEWSDLGLDDNSLYGTLTGHLSVLSPSSSQLSIDYSVDGGSGMFSGVIGTGVSTAYVDTLTFNYVESGAFSVAVVPEPTTVALMLSGLLCVAYRLKRHQSEQDRPALLWANSPVAG